MRKSFLRFIVLSSPLMLGACGEGWEMQRVDNIAPYSMSRTAGTGVVYVRVKMLPKKELKLEAVMEDTIIEEAVAVEVTPEVEPVLTAEEIFTEAQIKGGSVDVKKVDEVEVKDVEVEDVDVESEIKDHDDEHSFNSFLGKPMKSASVSKQVDIPQNIEPASGVVDIITDEEIEAIYESKVNQPIKEITAPKRDFFNFVSDGQENLDEIYNDPLIFEQ